MPRTPDLRLWRRTGHISGHSANNYQTLAANGGPSHVIDTTKDTLFLGGGVDGEVGAQQSQLANRDDMFAAGGRDDEDGVLSAFDLTGTVGSLPSITLSATNTTATAATLFGWIDINHNGIFENATERTQVTVPAGTTAGKFTLTFPKLSNDSAGPTYVRFRLSSDTASANATGAASGGEVEDYPYVIRNRVNVAGGPISVTRIANGLSGGPSLLPTDYFGQSVTAIGDLDGNGATDFAVGSPGDNSNRGAVYIIRRNTDGTIKDTVKIASEQNGGPALSANDMFGTKIAAIGDIDGDGITDLAIGSGDSAAIGSVYLMRLNADGSAKNFTKLSSSTNGVPKLSAGDAFLFVTPIGDIDADGVADLAVGASWADGAGSDRGAVYILRLRPDGTVKSSNVIVNSIEWNPTSADGDQFGQQLTSLGDLDGDGMPELATFCDSHDSIGSSINVVHVLKLNADGTLNRSMQLPVEFGATAGVLSHIHSLAAVGDVDGDGINDLALSGWSQKSLTVADPNIELLTMTSDGSVKGRTRVSLPDVPALSLWPSYVSVLGNSGPAGQLQLLLGMPFYGGISTADPGVAILTFDNQIPNTTAPAIPQLTAPTSTTSELRPVFTWAESARASDYEIWLTNKSTGAIVMNTVPVSGTTFTPTTDLGIGKYSLWVRAKNEVGSSSWSSRYDFVINTQLQSIPVPDGMKRQPELKWQSLAGADKYEIWISKPETPTVALLNVKTTSAVTSFKPPTALAAGVYRFWVRGIAKDGTAGKWSVPDDFKVTPSTTITNVSEQIGRRPKVEFAGISGAVGYSIWINNLTTPWKPPILATTSTTATLFQPETDLASGNYRIWVRGIAPDGTFGDWSPPKDFSAGVPPKFSTLSSTVSLQDTILLKWNEVEGATGYEVWQSGPGIQPQGDDIGKVTQSNPIMPITSQGTYRFFVRAIGASGLRGPWSPPVDMTVLDTVRGVTISTSPFASDRPVFTWSPMPNAKEYEIRIDDPTTGATGKIVASKIVITTFTPAASLPVGTYTFQVRGISNDGIVGEWSTPISPPTDQVPQLEAMTMAPSETTVLQWGTVEGATGYDVAVRLLEAGKKSLGIWQNWAAQSDLTQPMFSLSTLADGIYQWTVRAKGPGLSGIWSTPGTFEFDRKPQLTGASSFPASQQSKLIEWNSIEEASGYDIWINNDRGQMVLRTNTAGTSSLNIASQLPAGNYRVWIRVLLSPEHYSVWSIPQNISIT